MKVIVINSKKYARHEVFVDDEDYDVLMKYKWSIRKGRNTLYAEIGKTLNHHKTSMHCYIYKTNNIHLVKSNNIDHIDHNGLNNQKNNLRIVTIQQNIFNSIKNKNSFCKYKGVTFTNRIRLPYRSRICINGKRISLGYFATQEEAALAYNKKAIELFGEYAKLNIIE